MQNLCDLQVIPEHLNRMENSLFHKCYSRIDRTPDVNFEPLPKKKKELVEYKKDSRCRMKTEAL